jgi:hypothetical protein
MEVEEAIIFLLAFVFDVGVRKYVALTSPLVSSTQRGDEFGFELAR